MAGLKQIGAFNLVVGLATIGCGEPPAVENDHQECWEGAGRAYGDDLPLRLGTGEPFRAFDEGNELFIESGIQGGYHVTLNLAVEGLSQGQGDTEEPGLTSPQTIFAVHFEDGERADLPRCPLRRSYKAGGEDAYSLEGGHTVLLLSDFVSQDGCGNPRLVQNGEFVESVRVVAEVLDCEGGHAYSEELVSVADPFEPDCPLLLRERAFEE